MDVRNVKLGLTCPECGMESAVTLGRLESGRATCPHCRFEAVFERAKATGLRDEIESRLGYIQAALGRLKAE